MSTGDASDARVCTLCRRALPLSEFWRNRRNADGLSRRCRACAQVTAHVRRYRRAGVVGIAGRVHPVADNGCPPAVRLAADLAGLESVAAWLERAAALAQTLASTSGDNVTRMW